jgi:hypothetical protein
MLHYISTGFLNKESHYGELVRHSHLTTYKGVVFSRGLCLFEMLPEREGDVKWTIKNQDMKMWSEYKLRHTFTS